MRREKEKIKVVKRGYTLIELLVTVAILAVVGGMAIGAFVSLLRIGVRAKAMRSIRQNASVVMDRLEREVRESQTVVCGSETVLSLIDVDGEEKSFECSDGDLVLNEAEEERRLNGTDVEINGCSFSCEGEGGLAVGFVFSVRHKFTGVEEEYRTFVSRRNY